MLPMAALTALAVRSEPFSVAHRFGGGVLLADRFVVASVFALLHCRVSV